MFYSVFFVLRYLRLIDHPFLWWGC
jgi:hypothetical protein